MNSFLIVCEVFSFVFWKKLKTPKRHFKIIWRLVCHLWKKTLSSLSKWNFFLLMRMLNTAKPGHSKDPGLAILVSESRNFVESFHHNLALFSVNFHIRRVQLKFKVQFLHWKSLGKYERDEQGITGCLILKRAFWIGSEGQMDQ